MLQRTALLIGLMALQPLWPASPAAAVTRFAQSGLYICPDGTALRFDSRAYGPFLIRDGREVQLRKRWSFNGFHYTAAGGLDIRGRGREGEKSVRLHEEGKPDIDCPAAPAAATPGIVTGNVTSRALFDVPGGSRLLVNLRDSAIADAPAPLLAQIEITPNRPLPLAFLMRYPPSRIAPPARPTLSARIVARDGSLIAVSDTVIPLPPPDGSRNRQVEIELKPVRVSPEARAPSSK